MPPPTLLRELDTRIPEWDSEELIPRVCPFCGSDGRALWIRPDRLTVKRCPSCGSCFVSPAPPESRIDAIYDRYHRMHSPMGLIRGDESVDEILREDPFSDLRIAEIGSLIDLADRHVLDIGCGPGITMHRLNRLGARVTGIDPDPEAVAFARKRLGLEDVREGSLERLDAGERYDLVTMFDVVEHLMRPLETLREASGRLVAGGLLALWTPNASAAAAEEEPEPILFRVDLEHMHYLSMPTCQALAPRLGLHIVHLEGVGFPFLERIVPRAGEAEFPRAVRPAIRRALRHVPGFHAINSARRSIAAWRSPPPDVRRGRYHLFCIFRKPPNGGGR